MSLTEFEAKVKRSRFSLGETLRGARAGASVWLPAKVTVSDALIRISTEEDAREFRPRKIAYKDPRTVVVSGLDVHAHLERSTVRLSTPEEAQRIVSEMKAIFAVEEAHLAQVEEIPARLKVRYPRPVTVLAIVGFIAWLSLLIGAFLYDFVVAIVTYALTTWVPVITLPVILRMAGARSAWVRMDQRYIVLRTMNNSEILAPSEVRSAIGTKILLKAGLKRIELEFASSEEAARVFGMIEKLAHKIT